MTKWATLGEISFELLEAPDAMEAKFSSHYAEHALIGRKPRLQFTGDALDEYSLSFALHAAHCDPATQLKRLQAARLAHASLPFSLGDGTWVGRFVITEIAATTTRTDGTGMVISQEMQVTLREYTGDPAIPQGEAVAAQPENTPLATAGMTPPFVATGVKPPAAVLPSSIGATVASTRSVLGSAQDMADRVGQMAGLA